MDCRFYEALKGVVRIVVDQKRFMDAKEFIRAGRLKEARDSLTQSLRGSPADAASRTLLLQVLMFYGEWEKAEQHVDVLAAQSPKAAEWTAPVKSILHAEKERRTVFGHLHQTAFLPEPPPYIDAYGAAVDHLNQGDVDTAKALMDKILDQRPPVTGAVNGTHFEGFIDTDTLLTCFMEAFIYEKYVWIPIESIRLISLSSPQNLLDLLYTSAEIVTWDGLTVNAYLPVRYPGSSEQPDDRLKMGRMTEWVGLGGPFSKAVGQHVYAAGDQDISILEVQEIVFNFPAEEGEAMTNG